MMRRNAVPKVKLGELQPLPEPAEEMAVEVERSPYHDRMTYPHLGEPHEYSTISMLSSLRLDGTMSGNTTPSLFDSADDSEQGRSWQLSGDTGSSGFGNSVASFMSWTDDIEVETTKKVQELVDELERCMYGEESVDNLKKEAAAEICDWSTKFPHFRVTGVSITPSSSEVQPESNLDLGSQEVPRDEEEFVEEVIASHGSYQDDLEEDDVQELKSEVLVSESESSRPSTAENTLVFYDKDHAEQSLKQKVKDYISDQLFAHVWTEVSRGVDPLLKLYNERMLQVGSGRPDSSQRPASRYTTTCASPTFLPAVDSARALTPPSDARNAELRSILQVSPKSIHRSTRRTYMYPSLEPSLEFEESDFTRTPTLRHSALPPTVKLPQPLSLHSVNHVLGPLPSSDVRGYHSAADRRTRAMLNRRFSSMSSGQERFLKPLEEQQQQTVASKLDSARIVTPRQVSAPSSPPNWSRHITLPPIENLDPSLKLQGLNLPNESRFRSTEVSPRSIVSARHKVLSPIHAPDSIRIQGTGLSKLELAKQLLEAEEDLLFEKNGKRLLANGLRKYQVLS
ncbi:hypothetical protein C0J52_17362 [Blattella germanica]|nr:hypothetical protein C0J52_17362 [Blattella germanica]